VVWRDQFCTAVVLLPGHDVLFDLEHQRIGFAESRCDYGMVNLNEPRIEPAPDDDCRVEAASPSPEPLTVEPFVDRGTTAGGVESIRFIIFQIGLSGFVTVLHLQ